MKRYNPTVKHYGGCDMCSADTIEAEDGDYILFEDYEKEKSNSAKPTLSEVLAELEPMIFDYVESHNEDNVRQYLRGVLGKYFA